MVLVFFLGGYCSVFLMSVVMVNVGVSVAVVLD